MNKNKHLFLLIVLIILLFIINYPFIDSAVEDFLQGSEKGFVERVVDGDTIIVDGHSVRLLGINTPEKGERYSKEAKEFLENLILNKKVRLEGIENDMYFRKLRYVFLGGENINLKIVREGLANVYILDDKNYEKELRNAWNNCIIENKNFCEKSENKCADCVELKRFEKQEIVFYNKCDFDCDLNDWTIKDEGRKKFIFEDFVLNKKKDIEIIVGEGRDTDEILFWKNENYVWTSTGDTLFLRDSEGKLVLWEKY
ncbi:MAG: thermonuclease family protein [Nanoarchaeota archaeon]